MTGLLVLEDGRTFPGTGWGATGSVFGEAVFCTGMTGYQETLTDPSYRRQIVVATAPQIGNTGWVAGPTRAQDDRESGRIWVAGFVIRDLAPRPSNQRATSSLEQELLRQQVIGLRDVDTRGLTRHLRTAGAMRAGLFTGPTVRQVADLVAAVRDSPAMAGADLTAQVTTPQHYTVPAVGRHRFTVVAPDLGIKANTPALLAARGVTTHVVPAGIGADELLALHPDGVFLSNGPGDPATADATVELTREVLRRRIPLFGICFGNQILGRAVGLGTYKLRFGHRGINQPVRDETTGRVLVTAHNHGFAVDAPAGDGAETEFGRVRVGFTGLNDGVVEGLDCTGVPAFSVQFHPEAAAGPHDAEYLFDRFADLMTDHPATDRKTA